MPQYLLPCSCGEKVRVEPGQAGGTVPCVCGQSLTVPTLRGIRALAEAPPDQTAGRQRRGDRWRPIQGLFFTFGLITTLLSLAVVGYTFFMYTQASQLTRDMTPEINEFEGMQIDQLDVMQSYELFVQMRDEGLGEAGIPSWIHFQHVVAEQRIVMMVGSVAAAIGIVAVALSLFMKPAKPAA
jgi:hypothetical protein